MARACVDCGEALNRIVLAPTLNDVVWHKLAVQGEVLCAECMFKRAAKRDVRIALASLPPCRSNLRLSPVSWFELFASLEIRPPENLEAWRAAGVGLPNAPALLALATGRIVAFSGHQTDMTQSNWSRSQVCPYTRPGDANGVVS